MFVGTKDDLGDVVDAKWTAALLNHSGPAIVHYQELEAGHTTFMVGKDMSYLNKVVELLEKYNPKPNI